ncbi:MAG: sulfur carrier protein ThiS [Methanomassiliicoccaceae archaeon]|nr:sulfur carrier protein ThiS [Methanomassiliicoccaceae archaeon]
MMVNGKSMGCATPMTLEALILMEGYGRDRVAVELNGRIVPRSEYAGVVLGDGDAVEIVGFVGGG